MTRFYFLTVHNQSSTSLFRHLFEELVSFLLKSGALYWVSHYISRSAFIKRKFLLNHRPLLGSQVLFYFIITSINGLLQLKGVFLILVLIVEHGKRCNKIEYLFTFEKAFTG